MAQTPTAARPAVMGLDEWKRLSVEGFGGSQVGSVKIQLSLHLVAVSNLKDLERKLEPALGSPGIRGSAPAIVRDLCDAGLKVVAGRHMLAERFEAPGSRYARYESDARAVIDAYDAQYAPAAEAVARGEGVRVSLPSSAGIDIGEGLAPLIRFLNSFAAPAANA